MRTTTALIIYLFLLSSCSPTVNYTNHKITYKDLAGTSWEEIDSASGVQQVSMLNTFQDSIHLLWSVNGIPVAKFRYKLDTSSSVTVLYIISLAELPGNVKQDDSCLIKLTDYNTIKKQWLYESKEWDENSTDTKVMKRKQD